MSISSRNRINPVVATNFMRKASGSTSILLQRRSEATISLILENRPRPDMAMTGGAKSGSAARQWFSGATRHVFGFGGRFSDLKVIKSGMIAKACRKLADLSVQKNKTLSVSAQRFENLVPSSCDDGRGVRCFSRPLLLAWRAVRRLRAWSQHRLQKARQTL